MNFNQWYIFHFVQWPFAIFLVNSWFHVHRTSGLYRQKKCVWCSVNMVKNYTFMIDQFWPFFFDLCIKFVQLTTVDIRINRLVLWKQLKKYHTFPIPPNRQHNLFLMQFSFRCYLWWFITLGPWSFSNDVIVYNPFFITSDDSFKKKNRIHCV